MSGTIFMEMPADTPSAVFPLTSSLLFPLPSPLVFLFVLGEFMLLATHSVTTLQHGNTNILFHLVLIENSVSV
jgi:hypothetical protein